MAKSVRRGGAPRDLFLNFMDLTAKYDATDSSSLEETEFGTGLTIRGGLAFLIHQVEVIFPTFAADNDQLCMLCTEKGKSAIGANQFGDKGVIAYFQRQWAYVTSGGGVIDTPMIARFMPPVPVAAPNISVYLKTSADEAALRAAPVGVRLGFTTVELDPALYTEVAETWGY